MSATATSSAQLPFTPREHQRAAHAARLAFRWAILVWHRRAGKTVWAVIELILAAFAFKGEGGRFGYICPLLKQSKEVAWDYLKRYTRVIPGVVVNESELSVTFPHNGARIRLYGADNPDAFRGGYFDGVVLDEVGQMKRAVWFEVVRPMLADRKGWAIFIGTPKGVNLFSELWFDAVADVKEPGAWYHDMKRWNETDALSRDEVESARRTMSPQLFAQEFDCDFFAAQENVLFSLEDVRRAMERDVKADAYDWAARVMGVDVARFGDDLSAIAPRQGRVARRIEPHRGLNTMQLASRVAWLCEQARNANEPYHAIFIDVTGGLGAGPYDRVCEMGVGCPVFAVDFGAGADEGKFRNKRTEMYYRMSEWAKEGCLPADSLLEQELVAHTYSFTPSSQFALDAKDVVKERLGRSPDRADALACTFHTPIAPPPRDVLPGRRAPGRAAVTEYDPYAVA